MTIRIRERDFFSVELTPMIDVVFLLIVFFLVATTFHQREREMTVMVPRSETGESGDQGPDPVVVNVLEDASIVVAGNTVTLDQLHSLLAHEVGREPRTRAIIRAHSKLPFENVVEVADSCRKANVKISFATLDQGARR